MEDREAVAAGAAFARHPRPMNHTERHQHVMAVLGQALECPTGQRPDLLARACAGDTDLRHEVERLLLHEANAPEFMEDSLFGVVARQQEAEDAAADVGRLLGAYRITGRIGQGGMGIVYRAVRADEGYEQQVAIKLIKRGFDTDFILTRFHAERRILSRLEHENIARFIDSGTTDDDRPYYVMEYVEGQPITEYAAAHRLSLPDRLRLFHTVCAAVQYAHQKLIIHRDLKPHNLLVTAAGVPKLLDFGIAKLLDPDLGETSAPTVTDMRGMTPEYASPEQVRGEVVTVATDVYSLGLLLYELLSGRRAYRFKHRRPDYVAGVICDYIPEKPSVAVAGDETQTREGARPARRTWWWQGWRRRSARGASCQLSRQLRGDVDNIVMTALRKEPERRYASVGQFAEDIRRHLVGLPISASKDTFSYRAEKFVARHKVSVAAAALVALSLCGGVWATAWQSRAANAQRGRAQQRFEDVHALASSFLFELNDEIEKEPTKARALVAREALTYLDKLARDADDDPLPLQRELAAAYLKLGDVQSRLHGPNLGDTAGAEASYAKALNILERLHRAAPSDPQLSGELSTSYSRVGDTLSKTNNTTSALEHYGKALQLIEEARTDDPTRQRSLGYSYLMMGRAQLKVGNLPGALASFRQSQAIREPAYAAKPDDGGAAHDLVATYQGIGFVLAQSGETKSALDFYLKAFAISDAEVAKSNDAHARRDLMNGHLWVAIARGDLGDHARALAGHKQALAICQTQLQADPTNVQAHNDAADVYDEVGKSLTHLGRTAAALTNFRLALQHYQTVVRADADDANARRQIAITQRDMGTALARSGDNRQALRIYAQALATFDTLTTADPTNVETQYDLALTKKLLGSVLVRVGDAGKALDYYGEALPVFAGAAERSPANAKIAYDLGSTYAAIKHLRRTG